MKKTIKTAFLIMACLFVVSLASCGAVNQKDFAGTYELSKAEGVGVSLSQEQIDAMKAVGLTSTLEVYEDGTAKMILMGEEEINFTYNLRKMIFTYEGKDEKFTYDGKTIAFNNEGRTLEFTKIK